MNLDEYQQLAARTLGRDRTHEQQLANAALGLTGEAGEVAEVIKKHLFHATPLDIRGRCGRCRSGNLAPRSRSHPSPHSQTLPNAS